MLHQELPSATSTPSSLKTLPERGSAVTALSMALSIAFGTVALVVGRVLGLSHVVPLALPVLVAGACLTAFPVTRIATHGAQRQWEERGSQPFMRPFVATLVAGAMLGASVTGYMALTLGSWESLWFAGVSLGHDHGTWMAVGAVVGGVLSLVGFALLMMGLSALRNVPRVLDVEERFGAPALSFATPVAALVLFAQGTDELPVAFALLGLGLAYLLIAARRDSRRIHFVARVFQGEDASIELRPAPSDEELRSLEPLGDAYGENVLAIRTGPATYRNAARGEGLLLLGETLQDTSGPIEARRRRVLTAAGLSCGVAAARLVSLLVLGF
jgi:hypothetical protein